MKYEIGDITLGVQSLLRLLVVYTLAIIFCGIIKSGLFLSLLQPELAATARIASYITIIITACISAITVALLAGVLYFLNDIYDFNVDRKYVITLFRYPIYIFITAEIIRFILTFYLLNTELRSVTYIDFSEESVIKSDWYKLI